MAAFRIRRRVEFCDTDMAGIVHFSNFFRYMEFAEVEFLRSLGLNVKMEAEGRQIGFPRVGATCDYLKPARFGDLIDIELRVDRLGTKSATYAFEVTHQGDVLARGKVTSACCLIKANNELEAIPIPPVYRDAVQKFHDAQ